MKNLLLMGLALAWLSCSDDKPASPEPVESPFVPPSALDTSLSFLTFNLSVGFDVEGMLTRNLRDSQIVLSEGQGLYNGLVASVPLERMQALADSLSKWKPDIVALQECLHLINHQDAQIFDFLDMLRARIASNGGPSYSVLLKVLNPITIKVSVGDTDSVDVFFEEGNALLYKDSVLSLESSDTMTYPFSLHIPYLRDTLNIVRGVLYARLLTRRGTHLNVFNTHLEVESVPMTGVSQAIYLSDYVPSKLPHGEAAVVLGDFNDGPGGMSVSKINGLGFVDTYSGPTSGMTCCYDIMDADTVLTSRRIDYVLAKNIVAVDSSALVLNGRFLKDTVPYRISDHAGIFAGVTFH